MADLNPYFKSIIDQDRESVVICNLNHIIIYMNPAAVVDYGKYGGAALLGRAVPGKRDGGAGGGDPPGPSGRQPYAQGKNHVPRSV